MTGGGYWRSSHRGDDEETPVLDELGKREGWDHERSPLHERKESLALAYCLATMIINCQLNTVYYIFSLTVSHRVTISALFLNKVRCREYLD